MKCCLSSVPTFILTKSLKPFMLAGIVGTPIYGGIIPHYMAYCYCNKKKKWIEHDDVKPKSHESKTTITRLTLLIYVAYNNE